MEIAWKIQQGLDFLVSISFKIMFPDRIPEDIQVVLKIMKGTKDFFLCTLQRIQNDSADFRSVEVGNGDQHLTLG